MSRKITNINRRRFIKISAGCVAAIPAGTLLIGARARAQDLALLEESDPAAQSFGYKHDTNQVDSNKYPKHTPEQQCENCQLYQGEAGEAQGGCAIFPGKAVKPAGWCSAWVKKAG